MRKDESKVSEWCKHTRNARGLGKRGVNKRVRKHVKDTLQREQRKAE
jgi:hypothetical protein